MACVYLAQSSHINMSTKSLWLSTASWFGCKDNEYNERRMEKDIKELKILTVTLKPNGCNIK